MKKKRLMTKLHLNRETLRNLDRAGLGHAIGGIRTTADVPETQCLCPKEPNDETYGCGGPIYTGPFYPGCPSYGTACTVGC